MKSADLLDFDLMQRYVTSLREKSISQIENITKSQNWQASTTALLSYLLYFHRNMEISEINKLYEIDQLRIRSKEFPLSRTFFGDPSTLEINFENAKSLFTASKEVLNLYWPEAFLLFNRLAPTIVLPKENSDYESSSDPKIFSQIEFRMNRVTAVGWAEILVHELAHHYLFVRTSMQNPKFKEVNWNELVFSSIKNIHRPLIGLYHGAFAQSLMLKLAFNIKMKSTDSEEQSCANKIVSRYGKGFLSDVETLSKRNFAEVDKNVWANIIGAKNALNAN